MTNDEKRSTGTAHHKEEDRSNPVNGFDILPVHALLVGGLIVGLILLGILSLLLKG